MKSKSFDLKRSPTGKGKQNKSFDFISLYKSAAENSNVVVNESGDGIDKENSFSKNETPRKGLSPSKKKKKTKQEPLDISRINIEGPTLAPDLSKISPLNQSKVTSTPRTSNKDKNQVKSIMKNSSATNDDMDETQVYFSSKPKKRNKSVSFMLDDNEDIVVKKTKSEESLNFSKKKPQEHVKPAKPSKADIIQEKKVKKIKKTQLEKTKVVGDTMKSEPTENADSVNGDVESTPVSSEHKKQDKKKRVRIFKRQKKTDTPSESNNNEETTDKNKKINKKKRKDKPTKTMDVEVDEPAAKSRKKEVKPEVIAENLENLSIGDNAHTLTSLLDEMTVADKDKRKKSKRKQKKDKPQAPKEASTETENSDGTKEKVKWTKKWNKAKKSENDVALSVIVEKLPLSLICNYKKVLTDHFEKCGTIKKIGVAEVYLNESNTDFTTTIHFETEQAATEALSLDGAAVSGGGVRVRRPLPPALTTLVVRSYAPLSDQCICSAFSGHGRIRTIRRLLKGKKSIETVFIEFDGPEAVEKAIELSKGAKVAGKKIHVAKFEVRKKKKVKAPRVAHSAAPPHSDGEADSEDSND